MKETKEQQAVVTVTFRITEQQVNEKIRFIRSNSSLKASDGLSGMYIDNEKKKTPTKTISFSESGEHKVRIVLEDSTIIPSGFLDDVQNIYSVDIPDTVTTIEDSAFCGAKIACSPTLPPNLKIIERFAFKGVYVNVESLQLPDSVETVQDYAFHGVKHLIVGKNYRSFVRGLQEYEKVTIPDDNRYLEVRDGFIINRETKEVEGTLPGAFEDVEDVTIKLPEGTTAFDRELFMPFEKAPISIPGSVEKCVMEKLGRSWKEQVVRTIELAEGIKEIRINACGSEVMLKIPSSAKKVSLCGFKTEHLTIHAGCMLDCLSASIARLELEADVTLEGRVFDGFDGEIFVKGPIHFEEWGLMGNECVIHVPDEETGRKILNSPDFNKIVKIFIGADKLLPDQEEGAQDKRLFRLLGCPDYNKTLKPIEADHRYRRLPDMVTLLYNLPAKTTVQINALAYKYMLDDGDIKTLRAKMALPKGQHIIRLIGIRELDYEPRNIWDNTEVAVFEPPCDAMLIDDNYKLDRISKRIKGVKHLILGARCNSSEFLLPVERISVVPENQWLEGNNGCIINRETKELLFVSVDTTNLPSGIKSIHRYALNNFCQEQLVIPGSVKKVTLYLEGKDNIKELVFEEGVEKVIISALTRPDTKITFPSTMKQLCMCAVDIAHVIVPYNCELDTLDNSHIDNLEFFGDVALRPGDFYYNTFDGFSGNIHFHGKVSLYQKSVSEQDKPASFFGATKDECTITVANQETADAIKNCNDFNKKVKITIA